MLFQIGLTLLCVKITSAMRYLPDGDSILLNLHSFNLLLPFQSHLLSDEELRKRVRPKEIFKLWIPGDELPVCITDGLVALDDIRWKGDAEQLQGIHCFVVEDGETPLVNPVQIDGCEAFAKGLEALDAPEPLCLVKVRVKGLEDEGAEPWVLLGYGLAE